jgi:hypothetical protein
MRGIDTAQKVRDVAALLGFTCDGGVIDNTGGSVDTKENPSFMFVVGGVEKTCIYNRNRVSSCDVKVSAALVRMCYCSASAPSAAPTTALEGCFSRITIWNFIYKWIFCLIKKILAKVF